MAKRKQDLPQSGAGVLSVLGDVSARPSVKIRASSLSELFDCPARWAAKHIEGLYMPKTAKAVLGSAVHASTAAFDKATIQGQGLTVDESAAAAVDEIFNAADDVIWEDTKPREVEQVALALHQKYCQFVAPVKEYFAVEVECEALHLTDIGIILTGTTDRIRVTPEGYGISDIKTGKQAVKADGTVETKGHAFQMGVYELIARHASGVDITAPAEIIGMQNAKTDKGQRIGFGEVYGCMDVLLGTPEIPGVLETASEIIHSGVFWGNPKSMLCHKNYCPIYNSCNYRK